MNLKSAVAALFILSLASCGGGGSSNTQPDTHEPGDDVDTPRPDSTGDTQSDLVDPDVNVPDGHIPDVDEDGPADVLDPDVPGDVENDTDVVEPPVEEQLCKTMEPIPGKTCEVVSQGSDALLIEGIILSTDKVYRGGQVLIGTDGRIACVGCDCDAMASDAGATVLSCPTGVVSPGLVNAHDHITFIQNAPGDWGTERYEHRHQWRKGKDGHTKISVAGGASGDQMAWGELRQVMAGTTSMAGSGEAKGLLRNLDKAGQDGLNKEPVEYDTFPLGDSDGEMLESGCNYPSIVNKSATEFNCYYPHVAEGINKAARNEFLCLSSDANGGVDITEPNAAFVHLVGLKAVDGGELAANGTALVWSPRSNVSLYGNTAPVTMYDRQGVLIALGTDWTASGSMNILRELACADFLNQNYYDNHFSDRDLWLMASANADQAMGMADVIGSLRTGLYGDVAIFAEKADVSVWRSVIEANVGDTALVLKAGKPLTGDAHLFGGALPYTDTGCENIPTDVCGTTKAACLVRETGKSYSTLAGSNSGAYMLFSCDTPADEPSCVPMRPGEYTGQSAANDLDGDGVENDFDNCPKVFNPIRPVDENNQGDADNDGIGDACDKCPIDPGEDQCSAPNPDDKDNDTIPNSQDNCPMDYNKDQMDDDADQIGNVCDPCPNDPNPGNSACPATIYDLKSATVPMNARVRTKGVVTAVASPRFWIQVPEQEHDANAYSFSGIYIYMPASNPNGLTIPSQGDYVEVEGTVMDYFGQIELSNMISITVLQSSTPLPQPVTATAAELGSGNLAEAMEGVLVEVLDETVTQLNPEPGPGDSAPTNEYVLDNSLKVNDFMYLTSPFPSIGDTLSVTGILRYSNNSFKLEPRYASDIVTEFGIEDFGPSPVYVTAGESNVSTTPQLFVTLNGPAPAGGTTVSLTSSNPSLATLPATILVPAGQSTAEVKVSGLQATPSSFVTLTATFDGKSKTANLVVVDPSFQPKPVEIDPQSVTVLVSSATTVVVTLDGPAPAGGLIAAVTADPTGITSVDSTLLFEAGSTQATLSIAGLAEGATTVTVSANGGSVSVDVDVVDVPDVGLVISEVLYDTSGEDTNLEWVELYNGSSVTVDLSGFSIGSGGPSYTYTVMQLSGTLPPGGCAVIGGPQSNATNYNPTFLLAQDFDPDIQNSGATADGLALFNLAASSITDSSVPYDSVVYGTTNGSNLKDKTGAVSNVDVGDANGGSSIQRSGTGWIIQPAPTPNDCSHVGQL